MPIRFTYISQTETECLLQLTFDTKNQIFKSVVHFRYGDISHVTVFGYLETMKAYTSFKINNQYHSDTIYFRKATEAINDILERYRSLGRHFDPERLFKCVIGFLSQFSKMQKTACRFCGLYTKSDAEVPTVFIGLGGGPVAVAHSSCTSPEAYQ
uniref:Uncharacterized protein n=1 Tax=Panagrolaimus davidi TaxID=227884 RepID=A0A914QZC6_9BILA